MIEWLMNVEQLVKWELAGETEVLGETLRPCHFAQQEPHTNWTGMEPRPPQWQSGDQPHVQSHSRRPATVTSNFVIFCQFPYA
jgi:hypothetical protein